MSEKSSEFAPPQGEVTSPVLFKEMGTIDIVPGMVIEGFDSITDLDLLQEQLAVSLAAKKKGGALDPDDDHFGMIGKKKISAILLDRARHQLKFNGQLKDFSVTILPNDSSQILKNDRERVSSDLMCTYLVTAAMHSTGRGKVGEIITQCSMYPYPPFQAPKSHRPEDGKDNVYQVELRHKLIRGAKDKKAIESLLESSKNIGVEVLQEGVRTAFSAGLPSLGKRK